MKSLRPFTNRLTPSGAHQCQSLLRSQRDTEHLGMTIGHELGKGQVITLTGELGTGKTCLARGLAKGLGLSGLEVTSPTFMVIQEYDGQPPVAHVDLYRLNGSAEIDEIGLSLYFDTDHVVVIEWADRLSQAQLPDDRLALHLTYKGYSSRHLSLQAFGTKSQTLLNTMAGIDH